jgi:O-antigen ligase
MNRTYSVEASCTENTRSAIGSENVNRYAMSVALTYVAWLIMTPYYRFPILDAIHFERILILFAAIGVMVSGSARLAGGKITGFLIVFLLVLFISHLFGPAKYANFMMVQKWLEDYWKLCVMYLVMVCCIRTRREYHIFALGTLLILGLYWGYTLFDYSKGGSYVWQQGVPRLVGVWFPRNIGSANFTGVVGVLMVPFAVYCCQTAQKKLWLLVGVSLFVTALVVVVLSGTRGALIASLGLVLWMFRTKLLNLKWLALGAIGIAAAITLLPPRLTQRYLSVFGVTLQQQGVQSEMDAFTQHQAEDSAESRKEGLIDGFHLFLRRPILGYGPGSSAAARAEVSKHLYYDGTLELHNLYGQLLGETGSVGTLVFASLLLAIWNTSRRGRANVKTESESGDFHKAQAQLLGNLLVGNLMYGMVAHSLYRFYWILLFVLAQSYINLNKDHLAGAKAMNLRAPKRGITDESQPSPAATSLPQRRDVP